MIGKIKNLLLPILGRAKQAISVTCLPIKAIVGGYVAIVAFVLILYTGIYIHEYLKGVVQGKDLLPFLQILISASFISFVSFLGGLVVDKNENGIPDYLENKVGNDKERINWK